MFIKVIRAQCSVINVTCKLPPLYEMLLASFILLAYRVAFKTSKQPLYNCKQLVFITNTLRVMICLI